MKLVLVLTLTLLTGIPSTFATHNSESDSRRTISNEKTGIIEFSVQADSLFLYLNENYRNRITITDGMTLRAPIGANKLEIFGPTIPDRTEFIFLREDRTYSLILRNRFIREDQPNPMYAAYRWDANLMMFSEEDTEISVLFTDYRATGALKAKLPPGTHRVRYESSTGRVTERFIEVNRYELLIDERYFRPRKNITIMAGIVPGGSQLYKRQPARAALAFGLVGVSTGLAIHYNQQLGADGRRFETALNRYQWADNAEDALRYGNELDQLAPRIDGHRRNRTIFGAAALVFYAAHIFDTFREPDSGFAQRRTFNPYRDFSFDMQNDIITAHLQLRF
ncbi:MAG: DUF5683 domain-containing protein [Balneolia bacterium]|nr:DUF5683 domain-containing protein [Balneolia bacterium]